MVTKVANLRPDTRMVDPDVKVPEAVKRAAAAAEAAQAAAYPGQATPPEVPPVANGKDNIAIAEPPPPPEVTPPTEAPPASQAPPIAPETEETWEQRFKSERGRHSKTQTQLQQAVDRLTSLENLVHDIQSRPPPVAPVALAKIERLVSEKEEDEFGTEMLDVMGRRAREIVSPELAELRAAMKSLEGKITGTAQVVSRNARQDMLSTLDTRMPEWRQVNDMNEFKAWLALPDPYFGVNRHSALLAAFEQNDTPRVLNFFKGFVSELAATSPADNPTPAPAAQPQRPGLETLAAPGRARTSAQTSVPTEKQIITTADINAFYAAKARGMYNGREAEFNALEQELFKAQREGRVRAV